MKRVIKKAIHCVDKTCSGWMKNLGTQFLAVAHDLFFGRNITTFRCAKCGREHRVEEPVLKKAWGSK